MSKRIVSLVVMFLIVGCGSHEQELFSVRPQSKVTDTEEKDIKLILINAVGVGDLKKVKEVVNSNADNVNIRDNDGLTLLMIATRAQQFAVMEFLVERGAKVELLTDSDRIKPDKSVFDFISGNEQTKAILNAILKKEVFDKEQLSVSMFDAIKEFNFGIFKWLVSDKGCDPNYVYKTSSGKPKYSPLIYLFSLRGVEGEFFTILSKMFEVLVSHEGIDVNLKVGRHTPLSKLEKVHGDEGSYRPFVGKLKALGAH